MLSFKEFQRVSKGSSASSLTTVAGGVGWGGGGCVCVKTNQCQDKEKKTAFPTTSIFLGLCCLSYISTALALAIPQGVM